MGGKPRHQNQPTNSVLAADDSMYILMSHLDFQRWIFPLSVQKISQHTQKALCGLRQKNRRLQSGASRCGSRRAPRKPRTAPPVCSQVLRENYHHLIDMSYNS